MGLLCWKPHMKLPFKILISVLVVEVLGGLGGLVTSQNIEGWYAGLKQPPGTPPNAVFAPVWTTLFALMGIAFALVWHRGFEEAEGKQARMAFFIQMILNMAWTPVFFGAHQLALALVVIVVLLILIVVTIVLFAGRSRPAAILLVPYAMWVCYATYLNAGYLLLNAT